MICSLFWRHTHCYAFLCWQGETAEWVTVTFKKPVGASETDWVGVFSPAKFKYASTSAPSISKMSFCLGT